MVREEFSTESGGIEQPPSPMLGTGMVLILDIS